MLTVEPGDRLAVTLLNRQRRSRGSAAEVRKASDVDPIADDGRRRVVGFADPGRRDLLLDLAQCAAEAVTEYVRRGVGADTRPGIVVSIATSGGSSSLPLDRPPRSSRRG